MSETSLGIPVMPPLPPAEAGPLPPLDVRIAPVVPPVAPVGTATPAAADPEAQVAWKAERLDTLDYFELLGVPTTASAGEVKRAFYAESRAYHPDRFFHLADEGFKARVHDVYKRVTEAYYVLRDDVRRRKYLADVSGPERARKLRFDELSEQETKAQVKQQAAEQIGLNPKARQLFQTALGDLERGNLAAAERGLKMALTYEPQNALYKEKLTELQARLFEESRGKAFKINMTLDLVVLALVALGAVFGARAGASRQLASWGALVLAALVARPGGALLGPAFGRFFHTSEALGAVAASFATFIVVAVAVRLLATRLLQGVLAAATPPTGARTGPWERFSAGGRWRRWPGWRCRRWPSSRRTCSWPARGWGSPRRTPPPSPSPGDGTCSRPPSSRGRRTSPLHRRCSALRSSSSRSRETRR